MHRQQRRQLARADFSRPNMPGSSTCFCRGSLPCACRCRSAARPIISIPRRCARSAAWDPYNVTEDADLGMRLARFGYRSSVINSTTYEEAPAQFGPWLRQRTRWFKGWMQTWLVHMRQPAPAVARSRAGGISHFPAHRRRQCAGGAGASAVHGRADLFGGERHRDVARQRRGRRRSRGASTARRRSSAI